MPELLLDEVDGCAGSEPERRGGVPEVVQADAGRQACISQRLGLDRLPPAKDVAEVSA